MVIFLDVIQLENDLLEARDELAWCERLQQRAGLVARRLVLERRSLQSLTERITAGGFDPQRLNRTGFSALVFTVLGGSRGRNTRQQQDMLALLLKWENCAGREETLVRYLASVQQELSVLESVPERSASLFAWRESQLPRLGAGDLGQRLEESSTALLDARRRVIMLTHARSTGEQVLSGLQRAVAALVNAHSWGAWDLLSGVKTSNSYKQESLDEVFVALCIAQPLLLRFQFELDEFAAVQGMPAAVQGMPAAEQGTPAVVQGLPALDVLPADNGALAQFPDIFVDCLLADLREGRQINETQEAVAAVTERVRELLARISRLLETALRDHQALEAQRSSIEHHARTA